MSNPTSNFGWQMPEPTDLVTDLPADFEVFGQAVDTDFVDLLGGTTGQVLSKTSATDLDFTWVSPNPGDITEVTVSSPITGGGSSGSVNVAIQDGTTAQKGAVQLENSTSSTSTTTAAVPANVKTANDLAAAAIPKSTVTTNGDLIYGTGSATLSRIGIGSTGNVLTVAAGIPSWAAPAAGGMTLLSTTALSAASTSVAITGTGYISLYITVTDMSITQAGQMYFRLNSDSGSNQYRWTGTFLDGTTNALSSGVGTEIAQAFNSETTQTDMFWNIQIFNSEDTASYKGGRWMTMQNRYSDNRIDLQAASFSYQSVSAITNFTLFTGTAGTFSAGSIKIYGVK